MGETNFGSMYDLLRLCPINGTLYELVEVFSVTDEAVDGPVSSFLFFIGEPITTFFGLGD